MKSKLALRQFSKDSIVGLSQDEKEYQTQLIQQQLIDFLVSYEYQAIALYSALVDEVNMDRVIEHCLDQGKDVALPRILDEATIALYAISSLTNLSLGAFGILEPGSDALMWQEGHPDVIVIPGRVFDIRGGRLGRGRGHYDRLLTMHSKSLKIGVCFDVQLVDKVPMEEWDIPMDRIFSGSRGF